MSLLVQPTTKVHLLRNGFCTHAPSLHPGETTSGLVLNFPNSRGVHSENSNNPPVSWHLRSTRYGQCPFRVSWPHIPFHPQHQPPLPSPRAVPATTAMVWPPQKGRRK